VLTDRLLGIRQRRGLVKRQVVVPEREQRVAVAVLERLEDLEDNLLVARHEPSEFVLPY